MRKAMYLMGEFDDRDVAWLGSHGRVRRLAGGDVLVREGAEVDALFIVLDGAMTVRAGATEVARLGAGELVGEISFVDDRLPRATVTAAGATRVLGIDRAVLREKLRRDNAFAARFYRALAIFLADRLRTTTTRLGYGPAAQDAGEGEREDIGDALMETVSLGSQRFDQLLRQLSGAR